MIYFLVWLAHCVLLGALGVLHVELEVVVVLVGLGGWVLTQLICFGEVVCVCTAKGSFTLEKLLKIFNVVIIGH